MHESRCDEYTAEDDSVQPGRLAICPQIALDNVQRALASFEMQPLSTLCFHDPEYAAEHSTLYGLLKDFYGDSCEDFYGDSFENENVYSYEDYCIVSYK